MSENPRVRVEFTWDCVTWHDRSEYVRDIRLSYGRKDDSGGES